MNVLKSIRPTMVATAAIGLATMGIALSTTSAHALTVGGVTFSTGPHLEVGSLFENVITADGQTLSGYGEVTSVNGKAAIEGDGTGFCQGGCEITYEFGGFTSQNLNVPLGNIEFSGGWVNFYVDATPDFNGQGTSAVNRANASGDGMLWLTLAGHNNLVNGNMGTVFGGGANLGTGNDIGSGGGIMDVDFTGLLNGNTAGPGALANSFFDTNTIADNLMGFGDFDLTSAFSSIGLPAALAAECAMGGFLNPANTCLSGNTSLQGVAESQQVSEPASLAALGIGLIGLTALRRRRKQVA